MPTRLAAINRHPIKGLGEEAIEAVTVTAQLPVPPGHQSLCSHAQWPSAVIVPI